MAAALLPLAQLRRLHAVSFLSAGSAAAVAGVVVLCLRQMAHDAAVRLSLIRRIPLLPVLCHASGGLFPVFRAAWWRTTLRCITIGSVAKTKQLKKRYGASNPLLCFCGAPRVRFLVGFPGRFDGARRRGA